MASKLDFLSLADFLNGAIKDAGPSADLRKKEAPDNPSPSTAEHKVAPVEQTAAPAIEQTAASAIEQATAPENAKANKPKKKKNKHKKPQIQTPPEISAEASQAIEPFTRKLVTVRKVDAVEHFDSKNNLIHIDAWTVRAPKGKKLKQGDFIIFLEVDTFLPASGSPLFTEVGNPTTFEGEDGYLVATYHRISTATKKTVISQGHIFTLVDFPPIWADFSLRKNNFQGTAKEFTTDIGKVDYTSLLGPGVRKWTNGTEPAHVLGLNKFPSFIKKTDTDRVQNCPNLFTKDKYKEQIFQESTKMDGCSMTIYFVHKDSRYYAMLPPLSPNGAQYTQHKNGRLGVCSKNSDLPFDPDNAYWRAALAQNYHVKLPQLGQTIAVQGELVGDGIHDNWYDYPAGEVEFLIYSVFEIHGSKRWDPRAVEEFAAENQLRHVPVIGYSTIWNIARSHKDLLLRADLQIGDEGLVFKNCTDGRWFKVLSRNFDREKTYHAALVAKDKAAGRIIEEVEVMGYIGAAAEEEWLQKYEDGELDDDEDVKAFLDRWREEWYGTAEDRAAAAEKEECEKINLKKRNKDVVDWLFEGHGDEAK
ncbi:hypothetical protein V8F06_014491 [Rhypophila decipiens]